MCTVTYLPLGNNDFILTSNRDESPMRKTIPPKKYDENGVELTYPKDGLAGGTWIGLSEKKRLVCLLNGGFIKHQRNEYYKMSRGIIVKRILISDDSVEFVSSFDFEGIEPFTIILVDWNDGLKTFELVWDGNKKYFKQLVQEPKIWSSSTLYDAKMKQLRKDWFSDWLSFQDEFSEEEILKFHQDTSRGDINTSLKMKRPFVETVSTTLVVKNNKDINVKYCDYLSAG